jgi:hypothetical protein
MSCLQGHCVRPQVNDRAGHRPALLARLAMERNSAPHPTDLRKWKLEVCEGRQVWRYNGSPDQGAAEIQTVVDRYLLGLDTVMDTFCTTNFF